MVGLSFADDHEAFAFYSKVISRENLRINKKKPSNTNLPKSVPQAQPVSVPSTEGKKKGKIDKSAIGLPTNFRHLTHVGYDPEKGFSTMNVPDDWKKVFSDAGITEKDLQDKNTAEFIFNFMANNAKDQQPAQAIPEPSRPVPPVPPPSAPIIQEREPPALPNRRAPPPAPPSRANVAGPQPKGAPPPPPSRQRPSDPEPPKLPGRPSNPPPPTVAAPSSGVPPPPPPPPPVLAVKPTSPQESSPPKKATAPKQPPVPDTRNALMESIRNAGVTALKPVTERDVSERPETPAAAGDIASALKAALMSRQAALGGKNEETDNEEGEEDDW
jgi:hypothetical protein